MRAGIVRSVRIGVASETLVRIACVPAPRRVEQGTLYRDNRVRLCQDGSTVELHTRPLQRRGVPLPRRTVHGRMVGVFYSVGEEVGVERDSELLYSDRRMKLYGMRIGKQLREYILVLLVTRDARKAAEE